MKGHVEGRAHGPLLGPEGQYQQVGVAIPVKSRVTSQQLHGHDLAYVNSEVELVLE